VLSQLRFPIRFKILLTLLGVVTIAVSLITFFMANMFHNDKTIYIQDLSVMTAVSQAEKSRALFDSYGESLHVFTRLMLDRSIPAASRKQILRDTFETFRDFVAISLYPPEGESITVFDAAVLEQAGLQRRDLDRFVEEHPLPIEMIRSGKTELINATLDAQLPVLRMAVAHVDDDGRTTVVTALIRMERLLALCSQSEIFVTFLTDAWGRYLIHPEQGALIKHIEETIPVPFAQIEQLGSIGIVREYRLPQGEVIAGIAPVGVAGLLAIAQVPKRAAYLTTRALLTNLFYLSLGLLVFSALLSIAWSRVITRPLEQLTLATRELGQGHFDVSVQVHTRDEIRELADSFNAMATELDGREKSLQMTQAALIQAEKMSAFGQLGAGIAHEVKNPLAGILGLTQLALRRLDHDSPAHHNLELVEKETKRCQMIMENLLRFARKEEVAFDAVDVASVISDTAAIVEHQLGINQVNLKLELADNLPTVEGNANQLQQVLINLAINAQQAMKGVPGTVTIRTDLDTKGRLRIRVIDDGPGMPESTRDKVFEPFFSTKPSGEGTGLGLSVSYGIIREHHGEISVDSNPGLGSVFTIVLPAMTTGS
jgi:signal transduction histidine kinase